MYDISSRGNKQLVCPSSIPFSFIRCAHKNLFPTFDVISRCRRAPAHKRYFLLYLGIILHNAKQAVILNKVDVALCVILDRRWAAYQQGQCCKLGALPVIYIASRWIRASSPAPGFISQERLVCNTFSVEIAQNRGTWENVMLTKIFKNKKTDTGG